MSIIDLSFLKESFNILLYGHDTFDLNIIKNFFKLSIVVDDINIEEIYNLFMNVQNNNKLLLIFSHIIIFILLQLLSFFYYN